MDRKRTKTVNIGSVCIGGGKPVAVQSMTKTFTRDVKATIKQIKKLQDAGCQIIRCAVPEEEDALAIREIKKHIDIPLVADIQFNYRLALAAIDAGADKIRINPGNIGGAERLKAIVAACKDKGVPIRIGVNSGSLEKDILRRYKHPTADALVESAVRNISLLEKLKFRDIVVSIKSSSVVTTIEAYRKLSKKTDHPLHVGVTEAGIGTSGAIRSSVGVGALLSEGIGDTVRVSLTGDPVQEVIVAKEILRSLELVNSGVFIISCPTCGRCETDIEKIAVEMEKRTKGVKNPVKIAIMGCAVNGPGEAADADIGAACGRGVALIFRKGRIVKKVPERDIVKELLNEGKKIK
jgi:(E)-4-hydroxy-3-methylbut-2-enyl-diphosphate synthase